jgi:hypothetical protein
MLAAGRSSDGPVGFRQRARGLKRGAKAAAGRVQALDRCGPTSDSRQARKAIQRRPNLVCLSCRVVSRLMTTLRGKLPPTWTHACASVANATGEQYVALDDSMIGRWARHHAQRHDASPWRASCDRQEADARSPIGCAMPVTTMPPRPGISGV